MFSTIRSRAPRLIAVAGAMAAVCLVAAPCPAQMVAAQKIPNFAETFGVVLGQRSYPYTVQYLESSAPGNVLWPGDKPTFTFQLVNNQAAPIQVKGKVDVVAYGTRGRPGDIWKPDMFKIGDCGSAAVDVNLPAKGFATATVSPKVPETFGAYGLVVDLGPAGRQFVTSCIRTFAAQPERKQYPSFCLDRLPVDVLRRLGVQAIRYGIAYTPTTHKDYARKMEELDAELKALQGANVAVLLMIGAGSASQPLGRPRPHLDNQAVMLETKTDMAWLPENDDDFQQWVARLASTYGWPKGPVNCFSLWNEPWEGLSISGWGADLPRYRELYTRMALGVEQARKDAKVEVLLGGCDSSTNTWDKLFSDGTDTMLKWLDVCTIHYQGMASPCLNPMWVNRKHPNGRVRVWDTESWVANTDDRVAAVVAANRSAGYDRAMGVFHGNICQEDRGQKMVEGGKPEKMTAICTWPVAAAVGATVHFIGERPFRELLFKNGLPWVMVFDGPPGREGKPQADDGTVVVVGDLGEEFGADNMLFRTARGLAEVAHKADLRKQLAALPADAPVKDREALAAALARYEVLSGATLTLPDGSGLLKAPRYFLYDFYGNRVAAKGGKITIPLDGRGFFLRTDGSAGSFAELVTAVAAARVEGIEPLETIAHDLTARIEERPTLRLTLTNVLNRPVSGTLRATLGGLKLEPAAQALQFKPHETREVELKVADGKSAASNTYALALEFDAGADGKAVHEEDLHVNLIAKRTITVDGNLDDWKDVLPQTVAAAGTAGPSLTEAAWFPFMKFDESVKKGVATAYLAYDKDFFYFAAKVADDTPDDGTVRFETRNDDEFFYPEVSYQVDRDKTFQMQEAGWSDPETAPFAPLKPDGDGKERCQRVWQATARAFAIDLSLPKDRPTQVALYFVDWDNSARRNVRVEVLDAATGKVLDKCDARKFARGTYAVFQMAGQVRVVLSSNSFLRAATSGFFFDPAEGQVKAGKPLAKFIKFDESTEGNWKGVYGKDGYHVIGAPARYPAYVQVQVPDTFERTELKWPEGVRRYSYRQWPEIPAGHHPRHDSVQVAFNVLPLGEDGMLSHPPGTMPRYTHYKCTDYEYLLSQVAPAYGGGTEIWRMLVPGMPRKHFYPRQPKSPYDGPVKDGRLAIRREGNTLLVEAALPWSEMPDVKKALDAGRTVKFSFRANDNASAACLELARERSVSKRNLYAFHPDWTEHWANEVEFAFER
jgi:hypothetical protein